MYRVSVESKVVNFSHELSVIGEMIRVVYRSLIQFASRLCSLEKRISSYQDQGGYRWIESDVRKDVASDFYSYIKVNQRHILTELNELNTEFQQCKKKGHCTGRRADADDRNHAVEKPPNWRAFGGTGTAGFSVPGIDGRAEATHPR